MVYFSLHNTISVPYLFDIRHDFPSKTKKKNLDLSINMALARFLAFFLKVAASVLQIRGYIEDNSKIIFLISQ